MGMGTPMSSVLWMGLVPVPNIYILYLGKREKNYGYGYPPCPAFFGWVLVPVPNIYILYRKNEKKMMGMGTPMPSVLYLYPTFK